MKRLKKILLSVALLILIITAFVFSLRWVNDRKYGRSSEGIQSHLLAQYAHPTDLSLYQTTVPDLTIQHIQGDYLNGFYLKPDMLQYKGMIVTFGGSEGSPAYEDAVALAQEGYQVLSLFFFGMPNQVPNLKEVPLDYYEEIEAYIRQELAVEGPITVIGTSKGAEYSLLLSTRYSSIDNVVLFAPSSRVFAGLDFKQPSSSWSYQGQAVAYLDFQDSEFHLFDDIYRLVTKSPISYLATYESLLATDGGKIPVQDSQSKILAFAGGDDQMWPSAKMAKEIAQTRPEKTEIYLYPDAGHVFSGSGVVDGGGIYLAVGGDERHNKAAHEDSWQILLERLADWHKK